MQRATRRQVLGIGLLGAVVAGAALALSPAAAARELQSLASRPLLFGGLLAAAYLLRPLAAWPISVFSVLLGFVYGPVAFPVALVGAVGTCILPYAVARRARTDAGLLGWAGESTRRYFAVAGDVRGVAAARLLPLPADSINYGAGIAGVSPRAYVAGTALGEVPWTGAAVLLGASMSSLTARGLGASVPLAVGLAALAVLVLAGPAYRHWRERRGAPVVD